MVHHNLTPYAVLGVTPAATAAQITHAYRTQVRALHPDTRNTPAQATPATDTRLRQVLAAYAQLRHPDRTAARTTTAPSRSSDTPAQSPCTPTSSRGVQIPVTRPGEHTQTSPAPRPPLWAGPVRPRK